MAFPIAAILGGVSLAKSLLGKNKPKTDTSSSGTDWLGVANTAAGLLGGVSQAQAQGQNTQIQRDQLAQQQRQFDATQKQGQSQQALGATQMDPLRQQRSRQQMALVEQLMKGASSPVLSGDKFTGGFQYNPEMFSKISSFFAPEARAAAEGQFGSAANVASGGQYGTPNLGAMGYGTAGATPGTPLPSVPPVPGQQPDGEENFFDRLRRRVAQEGTGVEY